MVGCGLQVAWFVSEMHAEDQLVTMSRNWLSLGEAVPPGSARLRRHSIRAVGLAQHSGLTSSSDLSIGHFE